MVSALIEPAWWREASVYQIYPASFKDTTGNGVGDLEGVYQQLDYIKELGVDVVWLSPINKSPQVDMGYDISDYKDIDPRYGTLQTLDKLIAGMKERGLRFVLDLVVNHTSDQHEWFKQSRSSKTNSKRDWYIWRPARYDSSGQRQPPNNWSSYFTESAWKWDEVTQEYYLCLFADEQPDLNWDNPEVRAAVHDVVTFWLERGVAGFRLDVINFISKVPGLPDAPIVDPSKPFQPGHIHYANGPRFHEYMQELGRIFARYDAFTVGETPHVTDVTEILRTVGADRGELRMVFQFDQVEMDQVPDAPKYVHCDFKVARLRQALAKWQTAIPGGGGWNACFIENHDQARAISRYLSDAPPYRALSSKIIAMLVCFQSGTPYVYQGQELALANIPPEVPISEYKDIETINTWARFQATNPSDEETAAYLAEIQLKARDHGRTPMHWTAEKHGGFTTGEPWMIVTPGYQDWNAEAQRHEPSSPYRFWSSALSMRKKLKNAAVYGEFALAPEVHPDVLAFTRTGEQDTLLIVLNFSAATIPYSMPQAIKHVVLNNYEFVDKTGEVYVLQPYQGLVAVV